MIDMEAYFPYNSQLFFGNFFFCFEVQWLWQTFSKVELVTEWVVKSQPSFKQILHTYIPHIRQNHLNFPPISIKVNPKKLISTEMPGIITKCFYHKLKCSRSLRPPKGGWRGEKMENRVWFLFYFYLPIFLNSFFHKLEFFYKKYLLEINNLDF